MNSMLSACLDAVETCQPQGHENLTVVPLLGKSGAGPDYMTLGEAMARDLLRVSEVGAGHVPELLVRNSGSRPVLIVEGEELRGAKQNRVLNSSILIAGGAEIVVPVSCTEAGRWRFASHYFSDSKIMMHARARSRKIMSVSDSLRASGRGTSDQGAVWEDIASLHQEMGTRSPTGAMSDAYAAQDKSLDDYLAAIPCLEGQSGLAAFIDDRLVGADVVSRPKAYGKLHERLLRSYAMDALGRLRARDFLERSRARNGQGKVKEKEGPKPDANVGPPPEELTARTRAFFKEAAEAKTVSFPSTGLGQDHRITSERLVGSALVVEETVVHAALFRIDRDSRGPGRRAAERMNVLRDRMRGDGVCRGGGLS
jgi:hypothetical protein